MKEILLSLLALTLTALTPEGGEIPEELQAEVNSLKEAIGAIAEGGEPDAETTNALAQRITDLASNVTNIATKTAVIDKATAVQFKAINTAMKAYDVAQNKLGDKKVIPINRDFNAFVKNNGVMKVVNANNTNFEKSLEDEFSFSQKLRQDGFLAGLKNITLADGTNQIMWTEGARGASAVAVIAIGDDRPTKTNTTSTTLQATETLGQQTTVPVQLLRAINGVQALYQDDLKGDLEDNIALQVAAVLATAANPINITVTCVAPNVSDVIESIYLQLKPYAKGKNVVVAISSQQQKALNLLKDKNENKLTKLDFADLEIVNFIATDTYDDDTIFGWVADTSVRFYNDGVQIFSDEVNGHGVSGENFKKNQISLAIQYLNEALLIRGTDVVTTVYDSISATIAELTAGA